MEVSLIQLTVMNNFMMPKFLQLLGVLHYSYDEEISQNTYAFYLEIF